MDQPRLPGWGQDPLTQYVDNCRANQFATFANKRSAVIDLTTIDGMFNKLLNGAVNLRPAFPWFFFIERTPPSLQRPVRQWLASLARRPLC